MLPRLPVAEGEVTTIDVQRGCYDLGISIVGGCDTPLVSITLRSSTSTYSPSFGVVPQGIICRDTEHSSTRKQL